MLLREAMHPQLTMDTPQLSLLTPQDTTPLPKERNSTGALMVEDTDQLNRNLLLLNYLFVSIPSL